MIPRSQRYHFVRPPRPLRHAKLDNLALVPASLLPYKKEWQAFANRLPAGNVLIVLPRTETGPHQTFKTVAMHLKAKGYRVTILSTNYFAH